MSIKMKSTEKLIIVCFLFEAVLCSEFSISLPESVEALRGLCVLIPCSFQINKEYDAQLQGNATGIWTKDSHDHQTNTVFNSKIPEQNKIKGEVIGDLRKKNCTTIFYNISESDRGVYYFRIETSGSLKYTYHSSSVSVRVRDSIRLYKEDQGEVEDQDEVVEGTSVRIICSAPSPPCLLNPPTFTWNLLPEERRQEQNHNTTFSSSQLNFNATHLHHGQDFTCTATYWLQNKTISVQSSLTLHVLYGPRNTSVSASPSASVVLGSSVSLSCSSDANPAVLNYTWYRENGEQIGTGDHLTIITTDSTHSGLYYCRAQNQHGDQNSSVYLDAQYGPRNTSVSASPSASVVLGSSVSLNCSSVANPSVVNYTWYRQNREQIGTGNHLTINTTDSTHSGSYYCRAQNQHGDHNSSVYLDVQYGPRNTSVSASPSASVVLGSLVSLSCSSDANPSVVNYTWYKEKREQIGTGDHLTINTTDSTHSGLYYCRAQNQHGDQNSSVYLDVQYGPRNTSVSASPSASVVLGSSVSLKCTSVANPSVVNYTWYKENREQIGTGDHLTINTTDSTHSGSYYCRAQNQHGDHNSSVYLDVQYGPRNTLVSASPSASVVLGSSVSLSCSSDANPAVLNYTWYRENGEQIGTGDHLTINTTDSTHSGLYYCRAQNQHGDHNSSVYLDVQYGPRNILVSASPSASVVLGSSVSLSCSSDANPAVLNYTWYRENGEQIGTGDHLTINTTDSTHSGLYYCRAQNQHGDHNSSVYLDVQYAPQLSLSSSCNKTQDLIMCICEVNGNPSPKLEWRLSNQTVLSSHTGPIQVMSLGNMSLKRSISFSIPQSVKDTPTLHCVGSNHLGIASQVFFLTFKAQCPAAVSGVNISSVLIGAVVGALLMMILGGSFLGVKKLNHFERETTVGLPLNEKKEDGESVYVNRTDLSGSLQYSTAVVPHGTGNDIRGVSSVRETVGGTGEAALEEVKETSLINMDSIMMQNSAEEEVLYGNITRQTEIKQTQVSLDKNDGKVEDDDEIRKSKEKEEAEGKASEQLKESDGAECIYAQVKLHKHENK
ncbi:sialoadhesin-like isoform X3 [Clarias gariepinus]|uniref:sialoadhesin-like isoform X3 n=1 Tax=Clarias gariepinus TaxID=13013 RepID=UPI00234DCA4E|nr:sialoadhesin-like isoform X3 [Clarias gariepinus]